MSAKSDTEMGINSWLEDELYQQYLRDRSTVDESWKAVFGAAAPAPKAVAVTAAAVAPAAPATAIDGEQLQPLRGIAGKIAENMEASLAIPLATSQRTIAVKVMDENRRIINQHRTLVGQGKVSYTHLIGWAVLKALEEIPGINHAYAERGGQPFRLVHSEINLGIAVDVAGKDGGRTLMVPNIKNAGALSFPEYVAAFDDLVARARKGQADAGGFPGNDDLADESRHGGDDGVDAAADAGTGRDRRHGSDRLSGGVSGDGERDARDARGSAR